MSRRANLLLTAGLLLVGAVVFLGVAVYPFQFGLAESVVLAGLVVLFGVFELVLDDTSF